MLHIIANFQHPGRSDTSMDSRIVQLVMSLDQLLEAISSERNNLNILLDSQAFLIDEYLEIRPERESLLVKHIKEGRLGTGPWYIETAPFLVSPESIIRNFELGLQVCDRFGSRPGLYHASIAGGQIGQLPQILKSFGIESAVLSRPGSTQSTDDLFQWQSPNGSAVNLVVIEDQPGLEALGLNGSQYQYQCTETYNSGKRHHLVFETPGHLTNLQSNQIIVLDKNGKALSKLTPEFSTLHRFVSEAVNSNPVPPETHTGEIVLETDGLTDGSMSSHVDLKLLNASIQTLLECWAEPLVAWNALLHEPDSYRRVSLQPMLRYAWKKLLKNHSLPAVQGLCGAQEKREILTRFDHIKGITQDLISETSLAVVKAINTAKLADVQDGIPVVVFNQAGTNRTDIVEFDLNLPDNFGDFEIFDLDGVPVPFEILFDDRHGSNSIQVHCLAKNVPPAGYKVFLLQPISDTSESVVETTSIDDDDSSIENEFFAVTFNGDEGTFTIYDKRTGVSFPGLNRFVDGGDKGTPLHHIPPEQDMFINFPSNAPLRATRETGDTGQSLVVFNYLRIPRSLSNDRSARQRLSANFVPVSLETRVKLLPGVPRIDVDLSLFTDARDHRFRVHFPTGIKTTSAYFDGHFEVIGRSLNNHVSVSPQRAFVTVLGENEGLTIVNRGLPEAAVIATNAGAEIALTLLRNPPASGEADIVTQQTAIEPENSNQFGDLLYHYSIIPHGSDPLEAWHEAWASQSPMLAIPTDQHQGLLPLTHSLVAMDSTLFIQSSIRIADDGQSLLVRGYSISGDSERVRFRVGHPFNRAEVVNLDHSPADRRLNRRKGLFILNVEPYEIVTVRFYNEPG